MLRKFMITTAIMLTFASAASADLLESVKDGKPVRVGFAEQEPFIVLGPNGNLSGYEVDLLEEVLKNMGDVELEAVPTQFGALIPGLQARRFDVVASDLFINPDRCKLVVFAEPTHYVNDALIVRAGNPKKIHSYKEFVADPSLKITYLTGGGAAAEHALKAGVKKEQMIALPDYASMIAALKTDRADAVLFSGVTVEAVLKTSGDTEIERALPFEQAVVDGKPAIGIGSYAFRTEDKAFVDEFNKHLLKVLKDGKAAELGKKYGFIGADIPNGEVTTAEVCK